jgi:predicted DNA-binding WGR domain protein
MNLEAREMHCVINRHNKFYRIIRLGGLIVVRYGPRGAEGQRKVYHLTISQACEKYSDLCYQKTELKDYYVVYTDVATLSGPENTTDPDALEQLYLRRWHASSPVTAPGATTHWLILPGLIAEAKVHPFAEFLLNDAKNVPHAIDTIRDLVLLPAHGKTLHLDWDRATYLGPTSPDDTPDVLSTALGLYQPGHHKPTELLGVARQLVAAELATTS